ncbi:MAG: Fn3-like domain-containing protein [Bacteroidales bacterium]|nr:Fn3-like domain-containing protein [Bacteroidales bacterium]
MKRNKILFLCLMAVLLPFTSMASIEVVGSLRQVHKASSGDIYKGEIKIQNTGNTDQEIKVYQTDLQYDYKDFTYYNAPGSQKRSNAKWIEFGPKTAVVRANSSIYIQYTVTVPHNDSLKGTYWSVLMVEGVAPIKPSQAGQVTINTVIRYAIQIVTDIKDKGVGKLTFMKPTLVREGDQLYLAIDLENTGDHFIAPDLSMKLFNQSGSLVKELEAPRRGIFPGCSTRFRINLDGVPSGKTYQSVIVAQGSGQDVFGLNYTLYF